MDIKIVINQCCDLFKKHYAGLKEISFHQETVPLFQGILHDKALNLREKIFGGHF